MKSERIHIRIKPEDKAKLQAVAEKKRRTITSLIEEMIENLLVEMMSSKKVSDCGGMKHPKLVKPKPKKKPGEEMTTYIVVTSDGKDEWIEYESTAVGEAKRVARLEFKRNEKAKQKYTVEVRKMTYVPGCDLMDCDVIEFQ